MKKAIVTGANGFIGKWLLKELVNNGYFVYAVVRNEKSNIDDITGYENTKIIYCDLKDIQKLDQLIDDNDIDLFYHLAWNGSAGNGRMDINLQLSNVSYTADCVRTAHKIGCRRFVGAGSIMENEGLSASYSQGNAPGMAYVYGYAKTAAHSISKSLANDLGIDHVWGIITNAYGEGENSPRFINNTIRRIILNQPLQFTAATQNYDFIYITDVAKAFRMIGEKGINNNQYVIGSSNAQPLKKFILTLADELAPYSKLVFGDVPFTGINMELSAFDTQCIVKDTGFKAEVSFADGVRKTMNWIKNVEMKK